MPGPFFFNSLILRHRLVLYKPEWKLSESKAFADDNVNLSPITRFGWLRVKMGKGEHVGYQDIIPLFPTMVFTVCLNLFFFSAESKLLAITQTNRNWLTLYTQSRFFTRPGLRSPLKTLSEKGENAGNQHFLLFPQCFLPFPNQISVFHLHLFCRLQMGSI